MEVSSTLLACMTSGNVVVECAESINAAIVHRAVKKVYYHRHSHYLDEGRNSLVRIFNMDSFRDCDRLLMVDSDIEFSADDARQLEIDDLPIVSGVYWNNFNDGQWPVVFEYIDIGGKQMAYPIRRWPDEEFGENRYMSPIFTAAGVGAGFLMIKREVFDALEDVYGEPQPWFAETGPDGEHLGEDLCFCWRAAQINIPTYVDRRVQVAHWKSTRLGGRSKVRHLMGR